MGGSSDKCRKEKIMSSTALPFGSAGSEHFESLKGAPDHVYCPGERQAHTKKTSSPRGSGPSQKRPPEANFWAQLCSFSATHAHASDRQTHTHTHTHTHNTQHTNTITQTRTRTQTQTRTQTHTHTHRATASVLLHPSAKRPDRTRPARRPDPTRPYRTRPDPAGPHWTPSEREDKRGRKAHPLPLCRPRRSLHQFMTDMLVFTAGYADADRPKLYRGRRGLSASTK